MEMSPPQLVTSIEQRAKDLGVSMAVVCQRAGIAQSTITRWKSGDFEPRYRTLRLIEAALAEIKAAGPHTAAAQ